MNSVNVLVTGIGGGGHGEQILKALKLSSLNLYIVGTDVTEESSGKQYVDLFYRLPFASDPQYSLKFFEIIDKHKIQFVFHGSEPELAFLSENREELERRGVMHCLNSREAIRLCMNKFNTYRKLESMGLVIPRFVKIDTVEDTGKIDFYPVVLKPNTSSGGSAHVQLALDAEDVLLLSKYLLKRKIDLIAQEYVGDHEHEYTIGVSSDASGKVLGSVIVKRQLGTALSTRLKLRDSNRLYMISTGISQGDVCHHNLLKEQAEAIARMLDSRGPLNIQCRLVDGRLMLMEINPRLSGTTSLRAMAGYNEPELMIRYYVNKEQWSDKYDDITILRTLNEMRIR
jgi:carbamoyl-phosphate synthase large subunit